jgi:hypothetical protein
VNGFFADLGKHGQTNPNISTPRRIGTDARQHRLFLENICSGGWSETGCRYFAGKTSPARKRIEEFFTEKDITE